MSQPVLDNLIIAVTNAINASNPLGVAMLQAVTGLINSITASIIPVIRENIITNIRNNGGTWPPCNLPQPCCDKKSYQNKDCNSPISCEQRKRSHKKHHVHKKRSDSELQSDE